MARAPPCLLFVLVLVLVLVIVPEPAPSIARTRTRTRRIPPRSADYDRPLRRRAELLNQIVIGNYAQVEQLQPDAAALDGDGQFVEGLCLRRYGVPCGALLQAQPIAGGVRNEFRLRGDDFHNSRNRSIQRGLVLSSKQRHQLIPDSIAHYIQRRIAGILTELDVSFGSVRPQCCLGLVQQWSNQFNGTAARRGIAPFHSSQ